jgi:hypothetical protein
MFVRHVGAPPATSPIQSTLPRRPMTLLSPPPPMPSLPLALPSNGGRSTMAACCGPPLPFNSGSRAEQWSAVFAYDLDIALLLAPPPTRSLSYVDVAVNHRQRLCRNVLLLRTPLEPGSSPPRMRRGWFPASERSGIGQWGRIRYSWLAATALVAGARRG